MLLPHRLELLFALSLVLSFFRWGRFVLFPFQIFTTWVHECCHAFVALLLGGSSIKITLAADGSGLTHYKIANSRFRQGIVASAGYLGASVVGCLIFYLAVETENAPRLWSIHSMVILFSALIALSILFWIRNGFGLFSTLLLAIAMMTLNYQPFDHYAQTVIFFLAIQTALNALVDIRRLFGLGSHKKTSDAHTLQKLFYLPYWCWASLWLAGSMAMMFYTTQHFQFRWF